VQLRFARGDLLGELAAGSPRNIGGKRNALAGFTELLRDIIADFFLA